MAKDEKWSRFDPSPQSQKGWIWINKTDLFLGVPPARLRFTPPATVAMSGAMVTPFRKANSAPASFVGAPYQRSRKEWGMKSGLKFKVQGKNTWRRGKIAEFARFVAFEKLFFFPISSLSYTSIPQSCPMNSRLKYPYTLIFNKTPGFSKASVNNFSLF